MLAPAGSMTLDSSFSSPRRKQSTRVPAQAGLPESWYSVKKYYNRTVFIIFRIVGLLVAFLGVLLQTVAIATSCWYHGSFGNDSHSEGGLFEHFEHDEHVAPYGADSVKTWQKVTTAMTIASGVLGLFGFFLNARGLCAGKMQQRLYYIHSAGEIYFVGGLCGLGVAGMYPSFVVQGMSAVVMADVKLGFSYYLTLTGTVLLLFCTFCMMLDELIQIFASPKECFLDFCCICWKRFFTKCIDRNKESSYEDSLPNGVVQVISTI